MGRYVITITPEHEDPSGATAQTTVRVDTSTGQTRITELTVRAGDGDGLAPSDLPAVDLDLLVRALATHTGPAAVPAAPQAAPQGETDLPVRPAAQAEVAETATAEAAAKTEPAAEPTPRASAETPSPAEAESAAQAAPAAEVDGSTTAEAEVPAGAPARKPAGRSRAAAAKKGVAKKAAAKKAVAKKATAQKATARKATAAKSTGRSGRSTSTSTAGEGRPYRRMPAAEDVLAAYAQAGTVSGLADAFGVPRHTASAWARRLRQQGYSIGRG